MTPAPASGEPLPARRFAHEPQRRPPLAPGEGWGEGRTPATPSSSAIIEPSPHQLAETADATPLFRSFWMGGFESASHINSQRQRLDMVAITQHDAQADTDYALLKDVGILTARDGVRWHLIERTPGQYDFDSLLPMAQAAQHHGVQVIWNICHYGWPEDLDVFSASFVGRFARFSAAVARFFADLSDDVPFYVPFNEVSFVAWAIGVGGYMYPYTLGRGDELKRQFIRAVIAGMDAILEVDPRARFVHTDPIIRVLPPRGRDDLIRAAAQQHESQYAVFDMIAGRIEPELGGREKYLDLVGLNYYHSNQWETPDVRLRWEDEPRDPRWLPFHLMLDEHHRRYGRPMIVSETSHFGVGRARWLREIAAETLRALEIGLPLEGVCLYPIIDRPDWEDFGHWHNSGLFDLERDSDGSLRRVVNHEYLVELRRAQQQVRRALAR